MEFKELNTPLDIAEINTLKKILRHNLESHNVKISEIQIIDLKKTINKKDNEQTFRFKDLFNETIRITPRNPSQLNEIKNLETECMFLAKRYLSNQKNNHNAQAEHGLFGVSQHIIDIENFIYETSKTLKSVLIEGEDGCEKLTLATSIHFASLQSKQSIYELNCNKLNTYPDANNYLSKLTDIEAGTLYLKDIDILSDALQIELNQIIKTLNGNIRIISSTNTDLLNLVENKRFNKELYNSINQLGIKLLSLNSRKEDIPYILEMLTRKYGAGKTFSNASILLFKSYSWPKNDYELKNIVLKLIALSQNKTISLSDIERYAPHISSKKETLIDHEKLVRALINKDFYAFNDFHPSLRKALTFIAYNHEQDVNLQLLSDKSHISPSHLSFLFRSNFGISFKAIISQLRVEMIKRYFNDNPKKSITESALDTGFGDLSHFEKTFKKFTGMTPRKYKLSIQNNHKNQNHK